MHASDARLRCMLRSHVSHDCKHASDASEERSVKRGGSDAARCTIYAMRAFHDGMGALQPRSPLLSSLFISPSVLSMRAIQAKRRVCVIQARRCVCVWMRAIQARSQEPFVKRRGSGASEEASVCAACPASSVCVPDTVDKKVDDVAGHVRRLRVESEEGAVILDQQRCAHLAAKDYV